MSTKKLQILGSFGNGITDAKTLDGNPASYFATVSEIDELQRKVGETDVSEQITNAIENSEYVMFSYVDEKFAAVPEFDPTEIQNAIDVNAAAIDEITVAKVDKEDDYSLVHDDEIEKLKSIEPNANCYVHPVVDYTTYNLGLCKVTVDECGHISEATPVNKEDITSFIAKEDITVLGIPDKDAVDSEISDLNGRADSIDTSIVDINEALGNAAEAFEEYKEFNDAAVSENTGGISRNSEAIAEIKGDYLKKIDKDELEYGIEQVAEKATTNASAIKILTGEGDGSVKQSIDNAFNEFAANVTNDDVINTYKELIDYAAAHGPEFTELVGEVHTIDIHVGEVEADLSDYKTVVSGQFDDIDIAIGDHVNNIQESLDGKSDLEHVHDEYAKTTDVQSMIDTVSDSMEGALATKAEMKHIHSEYAEIDHTHNEMDDVVYASEIDTESATVPLNADTFDGYTVNGLKTLFFTSPVDADTLGGKSAGELSVANANTLGEYTVDGLKTLFLNAVYPVGSIYMSVNSTSPESLFGGTWTQITGRFLLASGSNTANTNTTYGSLNAGSINRSAGEQGGAPSVSYTPKGTNAGTAITIAQMPSHSHTATVKVKISSNSNTGGYSTDQVAPGKTGTTIYDRTNPMTASNANTGGGQTHTHTFTGTAATIATMPPYLVVYMWKRIA